jgi:PTS system cellobiose-specific IIB component
MSVFKIENIAGGYVMLKVMFVCCAGMSTSLLVEKVNQVAKGKGIEMNVYALSEAEAKKDLGQANVLLLGPQVRHLEKGFRKTLEELKADTKLGVVDMTAYGRMDGEAVLKQIMSMAQ